MAKDVLEVLRNSFDAVELFDATNKIAELIAADVEYDDARLRYDCEFRDGPSGDVYKQKDAMYMLRDAKSRRAAALAACRGL